jgi:hypothetical protein
MNNSRTPLALLFMLFLTFVGSAQDLKKHQWQNRIILLKDIHFDSVKLQNQLNLLLSTNEKLKDRDLLVFIVTDKSVYDESKKKTDLNSSAIIKKYNMADFNGLLLIGKDGGVKFRKGFIVNPKTIYDLIDGMPMRKTEMKSKGKH